MIAVAITTHNRYDVFKKSYEELKKRLPEGVKLVVVDDGSDVPVPEADFRFEKARGISVAKNKCLELMGDAEHYFLFDDDVYPVTDDWYKPYLATGLNHLCFTFDTLEGGTPNGRKKLDVMDKITLWVEPCGLMLYMKRICLDKIGGFDERFEVWGFEHLDLSMRIHNAGLMDYPFVDVTNSGDLFYSFDQQQSAPRSVPAEIRNKHTAPNLSLYNYTRRTKTYMPYRDLLITCLFTSYRDPQRGTFWPADMAILDPLLKSIRGKVDYTVITDIEHGVPNGWYWRDDRAKNPYFARWWAINSFLKSNGHAFKNVFIVDASDVTMLRYPEPVNLFCGSEHGQNTRNRWLMAHHPIEIFAETFDHCMPLLNAGILGGRLPFVKRVVEKLATYGPGAGLTDMAAFNKVLHAEPQTVYGPKVVNNFKSYRDNGECWFMHK